IRPGWDIAGNANGGYLLAIAARAMALDCERPDPVTITAHYLSPGREGAVEVQTRTVKRGKRFAVASAMLAAAGTPVLQVLGSFGDLSASADAYERIEAAPPSLPPPDACVRHEPARGAPRIFGSIDLRLDPADAGFLRGEPSGLLRTCGWFRLPGDERVDTLGLLLAVDSFPPTAFNARLPVAWVPTVELTVHLRGRPAPGWLRAAFRTRFVSGGFLEEDGEVWDSSGRLVAQSRQLALLPRAAG
ncbi:MAG: thioesterase family protein, partial [Gammaproteobacteria bacterium]